MAAKRTAVDLGQQPCFGSKDLLKLGCPFQKVTGNVYNSQTDSTPTETAGKNAEDSHLGETVTYQTQSRWTQTPIHTDCDPRISDDFEVGRN